MNIYTLPQQLPNSAYTLASVPTFTPVKIENNVYVNQDQFRDNDVKQITFTKQTKVQL